MKPTELYTRDLRYVTTVEVPQFHELAEVLIWGTRVFVLDANVGKYREAFAYAVPLKEF